MTWSWMLIGQQSKSTILYYIISYDCNNNIVRRLLLKNFTYYDGIIVQCGTDCFINIVLFFTIILGLMCASCVMLCVGHYNIISLLLF